MLNFSLLILTSLWSLFLSCCHYNTSSYFLNEHLNSLFWNNFKHIKQEQEQCKNTHIHLCPNSLTANVCLPLSSLSTHTHFFPPLNHLRISYRLQDPLHTSISVSGNLTLTRYYYSLQSLHSHLINCPNIIPLILLIQDPIQNHTLHLAVIFLLVSLNVEQLLSPLFFLTLTLLSNMSAILENVSGFGFVWLLPHH